MKAIRLVPRAPTIFRRYGLLMAVPLALAVTLMQGQAAQAAPCAYSGYHYYSNAWSGSGSNKGTGAEMLTWSHWSLNGHSSSDYPFSNEAVWTIHGTNLGSNDAVEVGFMTGRANQGSYSNGMFPYYTLNNGACPCKYFTSTGLPTNTVIWNSATSDGTHSWAYVNNQLLAELSYCVTTPRFNYEQAEVDYHDIWMGGGSGSNVALEYQTSGNQWLDWGAISGQTEASGSAGTYSPAGYGYSNYTQQPNGVVEAGYGQSC
jgi:hypothetical protein